MIAATKAVPATPLAATAALSRTPRSAALPRLPAGPDALYGAFCRRDPAFEGLFFTCVRTTGIFCRPTCSARKPRRENVEFVATAREALLAGYRPCRMCRPLDAPGEAPAWLAELVAVIQGGRVAPRSAGGESRAGAGHSSGNGSASEPSGTRSPRREGLPGEPIRERDLRDRGLDPDHVRRQFLRHYGMSLAAFQRAVRLGAALRSIRAGATPTAAAMEAGYGSESGFREAFEKLFGAPPNPPAVGEGFLSAAWLSTPLGPMLACASDRGLSLLEFVDRRSLETQIAEVRKRTGLAVVPQRHPVLDQIERELAAYFTGELRDFGVPLDPQGTDFERRVWNRLLQIPYGQTCSYAQMAKDIGRPGAARAIGRANGANRIAIVIPCHRVIRADGALCGYGGGVERKRWLLELEGWAGEPEPHAKAQRRKEGQLLLGGG